MNARMMHYHGLIFLICIHINQKKKKKTDDEDDYNYEKMIMMCDILKLFIGKKIFWNNIPFFKTYWQYSCLLFAKKKQQHFVCYTMFLILISFCYFCWKTTYFSIMIKLKHDMLLFKQNNKIKRHFLVFKYNEDLFLFYSNQVEITC